MKIKFCSVLCIIFILCVSVLSACTATQRSAQVPGPSPSPQGRNIIQATPTGYPGVLLSATPSPGVAQTPQAISADGTRANNIKVQLSKLPEISQVNVVVMGNTALVGYSPSPASKDVNDAKKAIADKVKQVDNAIANVAVSESGDMMANIGKLSGDITSNKPMSEISSRFSDLVRKITPAIK